MKICLYKNFILNYLIMIIFTINFLLLQLLLIETKKFKLFNEVSKQNEKDLLLKVVCSNENVNHFADVC